MESNYLTHCVVKFEYATQINFTYEWISRHIVSFDNYVEDIERVKGIERETGQGT